MKNSIPNVRKISDYDNAPMLVARNTWQRVYNSYLKVKTINEITPKAIPRSGIAMTNALTELLDALAEFAEIKMLPFE